MTAMESGVEIRRSVCPVCDKACGIDVSVKDGKVVRIEGTREHPASKGYLCPRGISARGYIYRPDRVLYPLRRVGARGEGKFERISWEEAYQEIAARLGAVKKDCGPAAVSFFSGHTKWYRAFLQRFAYSFGSPNYGTESSCCFTHGYMAWKTFAGIHSMPDMARSGVFLGWAYSPYKDPRSVAAAEKFRARGGKIIIVDCRRTQAADKLADLFLQPRPGTDLALALCLANILIRNDWIDRDYIKKYVYGFENYAACCRGYDEHNVEELTGVPYQLVYAAAEMIHNNLPVSVNKFNGHHINAYQANRAIFSILALTGCYDRAGGQKPAPFAYGHSGGGFRLLDQAFIHEREPLGGPLPVGAERFPLWYRLEREQQAMDLSRQILEGTPYPVKGLLALGMNYRMFPDPEHMREALLALDFFVDADLFLTDTAKLADIVLPSASTLERRDIKTYGGAMWYPEAAIEPMGESRSDAQILCGLAEAMDLPDPLLRSGPEACWRHMMRHMELGLEEISGGLPVKLPDAKPWVPGEYLAHIQTPTGRLELKSSILEDHPDWGLDPVPSYYPPLNNVDPGLYPYTLVTGVRLPNRFHSRLRGVAWEDQVSSRTLAELSHEDAAALDIKDGDLVEVFTKDGCIRLPAYPNGRCLPGSVHIYHGDPQADVNTLMDRNHLDPYDGFPAFRSTRCGVRKAAAQ